MLLLLSPCTDFSYYALTSFYDRSAFISLNLLSPHLSLNIVIPLLMIFITLYNICALVLSHQKETTCLYCPLYKMRVSASLTLGIFLLLFLLPFHLLLAVLLHHPGCDYFFCNISNNELLVLPSKGAPIPRFPFLVNTTSPTRSSSQTKPLLPFYFTYILSVEIKQCFYCNHVIIIHYLSNVPNMFSREFVFPPWNLQLPFLFHGPGFKG